MDKRKTSAAAAASIIGILLFLSIQTAVADAAIYKIPLVKLAPAAAVDLKCSSAEYSMKIPVPERWAVKKALLNFDYVNSTGLMEGKSRLTLRANGKPIAQINLTPRAPEGSVRQNIDAALLKPGYNDLTFEASQHYTMECEQPCAKDLWTTLKFDNAMIEIEYEQRQVPLKLSSVPEFLFDPKASPFGEVNIVLQDDEIETVSLAGIIASGIARKFDYKKVSFTVSKNISEGRDNILIGKREFIRDMLGSKDISFDPSKITGPYLKVAHLPLRQGAVDPFHALIVVSGVDSDQLKLAAETLSIMSSAFPDNDEMTAVEFTLPDIPLYGGRMVVTPDKKYTFKDMDFGAYTFKGINPPHKEITFRLPADFLIKPNLYVDLSLYYAYGAAMRPDSALNVVLNGKHIRAIHLNDINGGLVEGYKIAVPTYLFKPGTNVLRFEPVLTPLVGKNCENIQAENLFLSIFDNSTLYFPAMPHIVDMPKIELFMLNGFPITRWPDGHEALIYLASRDLNTITAAFNLMGIVTQKNGYPLFEVKFTYDNPSGFNGEIMAMGDMASISGDIIENAPLKLEKEATVPYPVVRSWSSETGLAFSKQTSTLTKGKAAFMEFQSPYADGRTVLLFTAATTEDLMKLIDALSEPSVQSKCNGDLVLIELTAPEFKTYSLNVGKRYLAGKSGEVSKLDIYLHAYPWLYYVLAGIVIIVLSLLCFYLLLKHRKRRIKGEGESKDTAH